MLRTLISISAQLAKCKVDRAQRRGKTKREAFRSIGRVLDKRRSIGRRTCRRATQAFRVKTESKAVEGQNLDACSTCRRVVAHVSNERHLIRNAQRCQLPMPVLRVRNASNQYLAVHLSDNGAGKLRRLAADSMPFDLPPLATLLRFLLQAF